jgi:Mor family transcriptional regulator
MAQTNGDFIFEFLGLSKMAIDESVPELPPPVRERLSNLILEGFLSLWGGCSVYIPRDDHLKRLKRNREIVEQYDGTMLSATQLAKKHGITTIHLYRIVAEAKKRDEQQSSRRLSR